MAPEAIEVFEMSAGFKWWDYAHNDFLTHNGHIPAAAVGIAVLAAAGLVYKRKSVKAGATFSDEELVPPEKFGIVNIFDVLGSFVQGIAKDNIGHGYKPYMPLLLFLFFWTYFNNLLGLVPGLDSTTANFNTTLSMGLVVFVYYNYVGAKTHGIKYLEHFTGHLQGVLLIVLGPMMVLIEVISHSFRPATLGIRLFQNLSGDHKVHGIFVDLFTGLSAYLSKQFGVFGSLVGGLLEVLGPLPIVLLGLLVCFLQSFVFVLLTAIYIGLATSHEEH